MAGRKKLPVDLIVLNGNKSGLSKKEIEQRRNEEVKASADAITAPAFLTKAQISEFDRICDELIRIDIVKNLDADVLGMYVCAKDEWILAGKDYEAFRKGKKIDELNFEDLTRISNIRDRAFKQAIRCASELGLTITSRCKLIVPKEKNKPENKFAKFGVAK